ncbi:Lysine-specific histone demethylase 1B, partial [Perkinsus olseni]
MKWVDSHLADKAIFPTEEGVPFPDNFIPTVKKLFRRLFRVYAHVYHSHFRQIVDSGAEAHVNNAFKHFMYFVMELTEMPEEVAKEYDAVVIGAGIAGLNCAKRLKAAGASTVVLEASFHIGGRCRTLHESDMKAPGSHGWWTHTEGSIGRGNSHFDVGAEFIHGDGTSLYRMAQEKGWNLQKLFTWAQGDGGPNDEMVNGGAGYYYVDGQLYRFDELPPDFRETHEILSRMADEYPVAHSEDMEAVLRSRGVSDRSERLVQAGYGNTAGGAFRVLSWRANCEAEHFYERDDGDHDFQVEQGFGDAIIGELEKDAGEVRVRHRVISVAMGTDGVASVRCSNGRVFRAPHVILCVPVPVLQGSYGPTESIAMSPPLPQWKENAIQDMTCSPSLKVYAKF